MLAAMPPGADSARPRSLLMTFFGAFLRELGDWIAVADLIASVEAVGLDEQAVRSAISRLKRRGVVAPERRAGMAGYRLTAHGHAILDRGDARIFERPPSEPPDTEWLLLLFSIPEHRREVRHLLRSRLTWLGLGRVGSAAWIGPAHVAAEVRLVVGELGVEEHVELFTARHLGVRATPDAVARWWDLDAIAEEYRGYLAAWTPRLQAWRAGDGGHRPAAFADHLLQLDAWRRIPFHDPGLPADALPDDWPGGAAWALFTELTARLREPALEHVEGSVAHSGATAPHAVL
jgi:phenylacetic acid degradation operon negative regulatory protein